MPTTRRKAAGIAASRSKPNVQQNQAKLTFHGRVTKPGAAETPEKKAAAVKEGKLEAADLEPADIVVEEQTTSADSSLIEDDVVEVASEPLDPDEALARKVGDDKIKAYWEEKEQVMGAPRAHLKGLSLHEKLLRQWDIDNRYGPCMGINRTRRWKRANSLGLHPPIEVLAVLIKEEDIKNAKVQKPYIDELMVSTFTE